MQAGFSGDVVGMRAGALSILRSRRWTLLATLFLLLAQSVATLAQPVLGGLLTDRLVFSQNINALLWLLFGLLAAQALLGYVASVQLQRVSGQMIASASTLVFGHLQALPLTWHLERKRGDVLALLSGDIYRLGSYVTTVLLPLPAMLLTLAGALVMMLRMAPMIGLAVAFLMPVLFVALKLMGRRLRPLGHDAMQAWADQAAFAEESLVLMPVIKSFAAAERTRGQYSRLANDTFGREFRLMLWRGAISPTVQIIGAGLVLLLIAVAGRQVVNAEMGLGELVTLFLYVLVLINPVSQLANVYGATQSARGTLQRLSNCLLSPVETDGGTRQEFPRAASIGFERVGFAYPARTPIFKALDLSISQGETIALVGANGAGKSTLAHLLLRLIEPQAGRITVGGIDVRDFTLSTLRSQIGLVSQQVLLFNATVAENIAYGRADASRSAIEAAARSARAHDFVLALPQGYDTVIGDQGVKLSGGQKQRIALARALLKDPPILILDEATAMFDPAGEAEFIAECHEVLKQRTVILITHRPASLALADRVLHLDNGTLRPVAFSKPASPPFSVENA